MPILQQLEFVWTIRGRLLEGLGISLLIALIALVIGLVIGVILALIKIAPKTNIFIKILDKFADVYLAVIRGTPMLVQLLIMSSIILVSYKYKPTNLIVPILAFGINSGAYIAEIIRSGISSVDNGQMEAGRSLGLSWFATMFKIVIPQAIKVVIPTLFNEVIILVKETSIISCIALMINNDQKWDLLGVAEDIGFIEPGAYMMTLLTAALLYLIVVLVLTLIQKIIERKMKKNEK